MTNALVTLICTRMISANSSRTSQSFTKSLYGSGLMNELKFELNWVLIEFSYLRVHDTCLSTRIALHGTFPRSRCNCASRLRGRRFSWVRYRPACMKAAVNAPHSKRFARFDIARQSRQHLECGGFSTAFRLANQPAIAQLEPPNDGIPALPSSAYPV